MHVLAHHIVVEQVEIRPDRNSRLAVIGFQELIDRPIRIIARVPEALGYDIAAESGKCAVRGYGTAFLEDALDVVFGEETRIGTKGLKLRVGNKSAPEIRPLMEWILACEGCRAGIKHGRSTIEGTCIC